MQIGEDQLHSFIVRSVSCTGTGRSQPLPVQIRSLENALPHIPTYIDKNRPEGVIELRRMNPDLDGIQDVLLNRSSEVRLREAIVQTMSAVLKYWELSKGFHNRIR